MAMADLAKRKKFIPKCPQMEMPIKHKMSFKKKESWKDPQTRVLRKHE